MKKSPSSPVQWHVLMIPATKRLRQEEHLFEASLGSLARPPNTTHTHTHRKHKHSSGNKEKKLESASKKVLNNLNIPKRMRVTQVSVEFMSNFRLIIHYYCLLLPTSPMSYFSVLFHHTPALTAV